MCLKSIRRVAEGLERLRGSHSVVWAGAGQPLLPRLGLLPLRRLPAGEGPQGRLGGILGKIYAKLADSA